MFHVFWVPVFWVVFEAELWSEYLKYCFSVSIDDCYAVVVKNHTTDYMSVILAECYESFFFHFVSFIFVVYRGSILF